MSAPSPGEVRRRILSEHGSLRRQLETVERAAKSLKRDPNTLKSFLSACGDLRRALLAHLDLEDALLLPALRQADMWGPIRAEQIERHHSEQRAQLKEVLAGLGDGGADVTLLADAAMHLIGELRADMRHEESNFLSERVLRDDIVSIDMETG